MVTSGYVRGRRVGLSTDSRESKCQAQKKRSVCDANRSDRALPFPSFVVCVELNRGMEICM